MFNPPAILHPADPDRRRHHRHGRHEGGHRSGFPPPHVHHHRWGRERRLQRHADAGRRRRDPALTQRRARPPGHRSVRPLPQLQTRESIVFENCTVSEQRHTHTANVLVELTHNNWLW